MGICGDVVRLLRHYRHYGHSVGVELVHSFPEHWLRTKPHSGSLLTLRPSFDGNQYLFYVQHTFHNLVLLVLGTLTPTLSIRRLLGRLVPSSDLPGVVEPRLALAGEVEQYNLAHLRRLRMLRGISSRGKSTPGGTLIRHVRSIRSDIHR